MRTQVVALDHGHQAIAPVQEAPHRLLLGPAVIGAAVLKMRLPLLSPAILVILLAFTPVRSAQADPIVLQFDFAGGFDLSIDGAPATPSGPMSLRVHIDSATPDLDPDDTRRGTFAFNSAILSAPSLGLFDDAVVGPTRFFQTFSFPSGVGLIGTPQVSGDIGWNGGPDPFSFMADMNDLGTLPLRTILPMSSSFFLGTVRLESGRTLTGTQGCCGAGGTFSAAPAPVPEPSTLLLFGTGLFGAAFRRWRHRKV